MTGTRLPALIFRVQGLGCALMLEHVVEILRPLPCEPLQEAPDFVDGVCVLRGVPTPVVNAALLLGSAGQHGARAGRLVLLRTSSGPVALAVDEVEGVTYLSREALAPLAPLLGTAELVQRVEIRDGGLLRVLQAGRVLPPAVWALMAGGSQA